MKKVLVISYQYPPCASSGVYRLLRFVKAIPAKGWQPIVLTVRPDFYPPGVPQDPELTKKFESECKPQVFKTKMMLGMEQLTLVFRRKRTDGRKEQSGQPQEVKKEALSENVAHKSLWQSIKDFITISLMTPDKQNRWFFHAVNEARRILKNEDVKLIYAHGGPWTALVVAALVKKLTGVPLVIDFRDPWIDNPYDDLISPLRTKINIILERWCIARANYVIANTEALRRLFVAKYNEQPQSKFITITNGYDEDDYGGIPVKKMMGNDEPISIVHTGTLYSKRSPLPFLSQIAALIETGEIEKKDIKILFVGTVNLPGIDVFLQENNLAGIVELTGHMPRQNALELVFSADILLLLQQGTKLQIPGKLFEYIRSGKPVFAICDEGATKDILIGNNIGVVADVENSADINDKFLSIFKNVLSTKRVGKKPAFTLSQKMIMSFSSDVQSEKLANIFDRALSA